MIIEITTYKPAEGVSHEDLMQASEMFNKNYCGRCNGLIRRHVLKTEDGYMDIFLWETKEDVEHVQKTFMQDEDALAYGKLLDPNSLTMKNIEVLNTQDFGEK